MVTALIHIDLVQKQRLARRAKLRGKSFSQEVRDAVDLYLDVPVESEEELRELAKAANEAADRMIKNLDATVAYVGRVLKHHSGSARPAGSTGKTANPTKIKRNRARQSRALLPR